MGAVAAARRASTPGCASSATAHGALLIIDEVMTGFRVSPRSGWYGLDGGRRRPLHVRQGDGAAACRRRRSAGRAEHHEPARPGRPGLPGRARCPGTRVACAAGLATLRARRRRRLRRAGRERRDRLGEHARRRADRAQGVPHRVQCAGQHAVGVLHRRRGARLRGRPGRSDVARSRRSSTRCWTAGCTRRRAPFEAWFVSAALDDDASAGDRRRPAARRQAPPPRRSRRRTAVRAGRRAAEGRIEHRRRVRTVVHLLRHGEVHNPDKILYGRLPGFRLSRTRRAPGRASPRRRSPTPTSTAVLASPAAARAGDRRADRRPARPAGQHRRPADRGATTSSRASGSASATARCATRATGGCCATRSRPSWGEPYLRHRAPDAAAPCTAPGELAEGHEALCVSHQLPIWTLRRYVEGRRLWHDPRRRQCALASADLAGVRRRRADAASPTASPRAERADRPPAHDAAACPLAHTAGVHTHRPQCVRPHAVCASARSWLLALLAGCSTSKDAVETGRTFQFVAPGGQTRAHLRPAVEPAARWGLSAGQSLADPAPTLGAGRLRGQGRRAQRLGLVVRPLPRRGARPAVRGHQTAADGVAVLGVDVRDDRAGRPRLRPLRGLTYDSISDYPGRSLAGLGGVPAQRRAVDGRAGQAAPGRVRVVGAGPGREARPAGAAPGGGARQPRGARTHARRV